MDHKTHDEWKELLESELKKIRKKGEISKEDLPLVKAAFSSLDHMESYYNQCNNDGYSEGRMMYGVDEHMSYGPNRSPVTGRYISGNTSYGPHGNMRVSYGEPYGYSGHSIKDRMVAKLESLYDEATTDYDRQKITNTINRIHSES